MTCMCCFAPYSEAGIGAVYALQRLLGKGAQGEVWLARERSTGKKCALKFISIRGAHAKSACCPSMACVCMGTLFSEPDAPRRQGDGAIRSCIHMWAV